MYFDFDDRYSDIEPVGSAINRRDGVFVSVVIHAMIVAVFLFAPQYLQRFLPGQVLQPPPQQQPRREDQPRFVFVQPRMELPPSRTPDRVELSDLDRSARSPEKSASTLENPLPMAKGNSAERTETTPDERMRGEGPAPNPAPPAPEVVTPSAIEQQKADMAMMQRPQPARPPAGGSLGEALKNLQKYVQNESFNHQKGQVQEFGPLQFDTKGVEFGPWIRRFVSQVRRNWFVPMAAMTMRGRVVITFFVHRNGALTDVTVIRPSEIESFNTAAVNALLASNPTVALPPQYPDDKAFFTVTFLYNESPNGQ
ncbi:MAG: TonB C-terminal domain-containing protein [Acidimicrobiia bacterium]|nr:TonB C-terminal domain-containing protein [Acidimicrobiia bacterium]